MENIENYNANQFIKIKENTEVAFSKDGTWKKK